MKIKIDLIPLLEKFIKESEQGIRRKVNGERISAGSIENYRNFLKLILKFCQDSSFKFHASDIRKLNAREFQSEKNYWKRFYNNFTNYLYKNGCHDNYVGSNIKYLRTFLNYLRKDKDLHLGEFYKDFFVRKEEIEILVLNPEQLKFLIHNKEFETMLSPSQRKIKDIFVFGCSTGLRFSDLELLTTKNFEKIGNENYIKIKTKKTKTFTHIKLSDFAFNIYLKYKSNSAKRSLFAIVSLHNFNKQLKIIGEKAGWTDSISYRREKLGMAISVKKGKVAKTRFCDLMSSHMMRRTAITTMLILGMPEHMVRNVSGHTNNSGSFYRYVHYAQNYLDLEISKVHDKLMEV
ncbi:MAG: tyrosine-type recombinase/integrase [Chitinophagales bacterium]|nr:tyrosine-type recombinase/integrase [Chitinophagales bacterium]